MRKVENCGFAIVLDYMSAVLLVFFGVTTNSWLSLSILSFLVSLSALCPLQH